MFKSVINALFYNDLKLLILNSVYQFFFLFQSQLSILFSKSVTFSLTAVNSLTTAMLTLITLISVKMSVVISLITTLCKKVNNNLKVTDLNDVCHSAVILLTMSLTALNFITLRIAEVVLSINFSY